MATGFGPRITHFSFRNGPNVLAELGDLSIPLGDGRAYRLRGGHRLWAAPEIPEFTYVPDNDPVDIERDADSLTLHGEQPDIGLAKTMSISIVADQIVIDHALRNTGTASLDIAPWAITQLRTGGTAIVPLPTEPSDPHGLQPNGTVVVWPYTGVDDDPFQMERRLLLLSGTRATATKIGIPLIRRWLAYVWEDQVFVKRGTHVAGGRYLDMGASGQCYVNSDFVELETLGEQKQLEPLSATHHRETWELHRIDPDLPPLQIPETLDLDGGTT